MKKAALLIISVFILTLSLNAQSSFKFGIKGGTNYNFSGDLTEYDEITGTLTDVVHGAENKAGFHGGVWLKLDSRVLFARTEVVYNQYDTKYTDKSSLKSEKLSIPLHLGLKVLGPLYVFAGPDFSYVLNEEYSVKKYERVSKNDFTVGSSLGVGLDFGRLALELKWDKAITGEETFLSDNNPITNNFQTDNRPNQLLLSLMIGF